MMIYNSTLTSKGQTTFPAEIREKLQLKPGDKIRYIVSGDRVYLRMKNRRLSELAGMLRGQAQTETSVSDMDAAMMDHLSEDDERIKRDWNRHERSS